LACSLFGFLRLPSPPVPSFYQLAPSVVANLVAAFGASIKSRGVHDPVLLHGYCFADSHLSSRPPSHTWRDCPLAPSGGALPKPPAPAPLTPTTGGCHPHTPGIPTHCPLALHTGWYCPGHLVCACFCELPLAPTYLEILVEGSPIES
jgi:hypothetical protein